MKTKSFGTSITSHRNIRDSGRKGQSIEYQHLKTLNGDLRELSRSYSSSLIYESVHCRTLRASGESEVPKRGSMYQSSKEVRRMRKLQEGRREKESGHRDEDFISFEIVDHLRRHNTRKTNRVQHPKRLPLNYSSAESKPSTDTTCSMEFLDLSFRDLPNKDLTTNISSLGSKSRKDQPLAIPMRSIDGITRCKKVAPKLAESGSLKEQRFHCHKNIGPQTHDKIICKTDLLKTLPKCASENAKMSHRVTQLDYGLAEEKGPKTMLSPLKRMFHPIMKSKSVRSSPLSGIKSGKNIEINLTDTRIGVFQKSFQSESPILGQNIENDSCLMGGASCSATISPAHLHGILKLETENGNPSLGFCLQDPADVLSAKTWRTGDALNWVYTFHRSETKLNSGRGTKDKHRDSHPLVGQMQVSSYLYSDINENGSLPNSTITDFVLYDIARGRMNSIVEEKSKCSSGSIQPVPSNAMEAVATGGHLERKNSVERPEPPRHGFSSSDSNASTSFPWLQKNLHSELEIAAIQLQIPFNKKESWKNTKEFGPNEAALDPGKECMNNLNHAVVKVVTPNGAHGFPNTNKSHPSCLLDRWRSGGGCDCGGWDMACPIVVLSNSHPNNSVGCLTWENQKTITLFVEGSKENVPSLTITADGDGQYSVDFHAHFSSLQAFSICIAILHGSYVSSALIQEKCKQSLYSNSLKLLLEEEVRHLIETTATEEQRKRKKGVEQVLSFFIDPPFSPIGRV